MSVLRKVIAGGPNRPTRLHTERGELIPLNEFRHIPRAALSKLRVKLKGTRPDVPWWPIKVIPMIDETLDYTSDVIEFGSGSSTIWLAQRAGTVHSIEDNQVWCERINSRLEHMGLRNATVTRAFGADYYSIGFLEQQRFDLAVVDGLYRWKCIETILPQMKPGGIVYLDNSDADKDLTLYPNKSDRHLAQRILENFAQIHPEARLSRHSSMISGELYAGEGMILRMPETEC